MTTKETITGVDGRERRRGGDLLDMAGYNDDLVKTGRCLLEGQTFDIASACLFMRLTTLQKKWY